MFTIIYYLSLYNSDKEVNINFRFWLCYMYPIMMSVAFYIVPAPMMALYILYFTMMLLIIDIISYMDINHVFYIIACICILLTFPLPHGYIRDGYRVDNISEESKELIDIEEQIRVFNSQKFLIIQYLDDGKLISRDISIDAFEFRELEDKNDIIFKTTELKRYGSKLTFIVDKSYLNRKDN